MAVTDERVSRRRLLKRAGIGVAAVGAGSMITAAPAAAQHGGHGDVDCIGAGGCGECDLQTVCGSNCGCVITVDGCCFCHEGSSCASLSPCHTDAQCPAGWRCAYSCCGGTLCLPPCGGGHDGLNQGGAMSNGGAGGAGPAAPEPEAAPGDGGHNHG